MILIKKNSGSAYIFVLMILTIASLILSLIFNSVNLKFEKNHGQNNNLLAMAQYGSKKFLSALTQIADMSFKLEGEKNIFDTQLFYKNVEKYFPVEEINFTLADNLNGETMSYYVTICFEKIGLFDAEYNLSSTAKNHYVNQIILEQKVKFDTLEKNFKIGKEEIK